MRDYGKVFTCIWASESFRALSEDGRTLALYLLTCPHGTIAGVFRLPDGYAVDDLQWPSERVYEGFQELSENGFATRCERTKWVWVQKHLEWNPPENPNQRKGALKQAQQVPEQCTWRGGFARKYGDLLGMEPAADVGEAETLQQGFANQYQEQEQKQYQEQEQEEKTTKTARKRAAPPTSIEAPDDVSGQVWADWVKHRKSKRASITETVLEGARAEAAKAGITLEAFLRIWCLRGTQGLEASWIKPSEINATRARSPSAAEQRILEAVPTLAATHLRPGQQTTEFEVFDVTPAALG